MINNWLITGDTHGNFTRFKNYPDDIQKDPETAVIILGDAGLNWTLTEEDSHMKNFLNKKYDFSIYCVRGNHEARPQDVKDMKLIYDENVQGEVYYQERFPKIKYFKDWGIYILGKYKVAVIGGAYSVDKMYRLQNNFRWFENEQLSTEEMLDCIKDFTDQTVDFIFSHTCPFRWVPRDLFLSQIDQSSVDNSMEFFLDEIIDRMDWQIYCFGHYHKDRLERPKVEQFFEATKSLDGVWSFWQNANLTYAEKSPNYYMED